MLRLYPLPVESDKLVEEVVVLCKISLFYFLQGCGVHGICGGVRGSGDKVLEHAYEG